MREDKEDRAIPAAAGKRRRKRPRPGRGPGQDKGADRKIGKDEQIAAAGERIAKRIARAGLCSRRDAERWILAGRVAVDGVTLSTPAVVVNDANAISVDGRPLPEKSARRLWRYHKPTGLVTSHKDPAGRPTVFERLPAGMPRVVSVGRLDLNAEGLLLLTNDGGLARALELPATGWSRRYRVRVHGDVDPAALKKLEEGTTISGIHYGPIKATLDRKQGSNAWLTMTLAEGKNREIRRVMEHLGLKVTRLIRVAYGPFQLGHLPKGQVDEILKKALREQIGSLGGGPEKGPGEGLGEGKRAAR